MRQRVSLKWQYLLNYLSIALIACALIGLALYVNSLERLNQSINEAVAVELTTAASYLEEQTKVFQDVASLGRKCNRHHAGLLLNAKDERLQIIHRYGACCTRV